MRLPADLEKKMRDGVGCKGCLAEEGETKKCLDPDEDDEDYDYPCPKNPTPPDGGWAWVVAMGAFLNLMITEGVMFSFAHVGHELFDVFDSSHSQISWIGSSLTGCSYLVGPFAAALCARYGCRAVTIAGGLIATLGLLLSANATSVSSLIATYGVISGVGLGLLYLPSVVAVSHWFDKKRALATGFIFVGASVGQFVFPAMMPGLKERYNWQGLMFIMAGIVLNSCVCGMLFISVDKWKTAIRRPVNHKVEIVRGEIMKALIESKKRERTTSNGSLDGCVITRDNQLIKVDPKLFEGKRNNSLLARFRRHFGFSSQSLASSKSSLQAIPSIVIDAVNKDLSMKAAAKANSHSASLTNSPIYRPSAGRVAELQQQGWSCEKRGSLPNSCCSVNRGVGYTNLATIPSTDLGEGSTPVSPPAGGRVCKTRSCDVIPGEDGADSASPALTNVEGKPARGMTQTKSASDLQTVGPILPLLPSNMDESVLSIQSIQVIPNSIHHELAASRAKGLRCRSTRSESSTVSFGGFSFSRAESTTASTLVYGSAGSLSQLQASLEEVELELSSEGSRQTLPAKCLTVLLDMLHFSLLFNPIFSFFLISTFLTLMGFLIPYFYFPLKGQTQGMDEPSSNFLLIILGITNTVGRILCGWLADRPWVNTLYFYCGSLVVAGLAMLYSPFCYTHVSLAVLAGVVGLCYAVTICLRSVLLVEYLGLENLAKSYGMLALFQGVASMIGAPIAGQLLGLTGGVDNCFFMAGALTVASGLLLFPIKCLRIASAPGSTLKEGECAGQDEC